MAFAIDTLSLFGMAFHLGGGTGDLVLADAGDTVRTCVCV